MHGLVADAGTLERNGDLPEAEAAHVAVVAKQARDKARSWGSSDDPYHILGVRRGASAREIRAAYLCLVKELHPDGRTPDPDDPDHDANERLKAINAAYRKLKAAGGAGRRGWARGALFAVGVLTSALPLFAVMGAYYAGWLGVRAPVPGIVAAPQSQGTASVTSVEKDSAVGRRMAFVDARTQATKAAWVKFIADYPGGEPEALARQAIAAIEGAEAAEARKRQEHLAWLAAEKGTKTDLQQFLARHADGEHAGKARLALAAIASAEAKARAERTAWAVTEGAGTKEALQRFLDKHRDAPQAPQASKALAAIASAETKARAEQETWIKAKEDAGKAALHTYLSEHPSGRHAAEAKARVARLEADEKDDEAWRLALRRNSKAAYAGYVSAHPKGRRVAEARVRIAGLGRAGAPAKAAVREARVEPVKTPSVRPPRPPTAAVLEPFVGADGRIRR
ncbi:MAG: J domain-containing protein [Hyphomicrobiaceae bacterium]